MEQEQVEKMISDLLTRPRKAGQEFAVIIPILFSETIKGCEGLVHFYGSYRTETEAVEAAERLSVKYPGQTVLIDDPQCQWFEIRRKYSRTEILPLDVPNEINEKSKEYMKQLREIKDKEEQARAARKKQQELAMRDDNIQAYIIWTFQLYGQLKEFEKISKNIKSINTYGVTETCTPGSSNYELLSSLTQENKTKIKKFLTDHMDKVKDFNELVNDQFLANDEVYMIPLLITQHIINLRDYQHW